MFNTRMVIIFLWVPAYAQDIRSWYTQHKTARAYQEGDIQTAHTLYTDLVKENPQDALVNFNEGFLLYKQGDYPHAAASFERAAQQASSVSGEQQQEIYFNLGNAKAYQKEWQQAIDAYDKVLEQNPDHERAQHNKEIVRKLQEQEKQQQKKEQQQKQQDKQKEEQEKNNQKEQQQPPPSDDQQAPSPKEKEKTSNTPEQQGNQQQGQENKPDNKGDDAKQAADEHKQERSDKMNKNKEAEEQKAQEQKHTTPSSKDISDYKTSSAGEQAQDAKEQDEIGQLLEQVDKKDTQQAKRLMQVMLAQIKGGQYENKPSW